LFRRRRGTDPRTALKVVTESPKDKMVRYLADALRHRHGLAEDEAIAVATKTFNREQQRVGKKSRISGKQRTVASRIGPAGFASATAAFVSLFRPKKRKSKSARTSAIQATKTRKRKKCSRSRRGSMFVQGGAPGLGKRS
jgi:hypothetical protein